MQAPMQALHPPTGDNNHDSFKLQRTTLSVYPPMNDSFDEPG